ncbi:hypothetical protein CDES_12250 [Corynebacterium deserti GIMN1.010]|uniref:Integral membrane protein n=1 Tax=Corynebacterium deserti GIMN1.010 TaxID=931089 RepID=A0A0M4CZ41_9CORY|nr:ABC transporter permease [Corynebacterium deserti]ALC06800.1 hypothetical protein CDES_12250 [Corynebacterium deserti GIMN1.010]
MSDTTTAEPRPSWVKVLGLSLGLPVIIGLMLFAFLAPSTASGAKDLPLAISAPEPVVTSMEDALNTQAPEAFEFSEMADADEAQDSIMNRETIGGIVVDPATQITTIYTATGNGAPYATMLNTMAQGMQAQGQNVVVEDLAPLAENDPQGTGVALLGLPLAFGGMVSAVALTFLLKNKPWHNLIGSLAVSFVGSLVVASIMHFGYDLFPESTNFWGVVGTIALGIAATSLVVTGLASLIGPAGLGIGAILTIFVSNPLSGLSTGWWWLPSPWGAIGQYIPIGATGHLLRSDLFFDGQGGTPALWVLLTWTIIGAALIALSAVRLPRQEQCTGSCRLTCSIEKIRHNHQVEPDFLCAS